MCVLRMRTSANGACKGERVAFPELSPYAKVPDSVSWGPRWPPGCHASSPHRKSIHVPGWNVVLAAPTWMLLVDGLYLAVALLLCQTF